ncbi:MAG: D-hexose-6-phosphate mutarotase [Ornithinimicrobium sp.]
MAAFTPRTLTSGDGVLTAYDHGAHIASWAIREVPVVWVSRRSEYVTDVAIRGGIPICWPWFASGPDGDRKPSHGLARTSTWELLEQQADSATWRLAPHMMADAGRLPEGDVICEMHVMLTPESMQVRHTTTNVGNDPMTYELALHTYLHVGDVRHVEVLGLDGVPYFDKVIQQDGTQDDLLRVDGEVDRIYHSPGPVSVVDRILGRELTVRSEGADNTVIWNPGPEGAASMSDFDDAEWTQMICVETANIGQQGIHLAPGESHTTTALISVSAAPDAEQDG